MQTKSNVFQQKLQTLEQQIKQIFDCDDSIILKESRYQNIFIDICLEEHVLLSNISNLENDVLPNLMNKIQAIEAEIQTLDQKKMKLDSMISSFKKLSNELDTKMEIFLKESKDAQKSQHQNRDHLTHSFSLRVDEITVRLRTLETRKMMLATQYDTLQNDLKTCTDDFQHYDKLFHSLMSTPLLPSIMKLLNNNQDKTSSSAAAVVKKNSVLATTSVTKKDVPVGNNGDHDDGDDAYIQERITRSNNIQSVSASTISSSLYSSPSSSSCTERASEQCNNSGGDDEVNEIVTAGDKDNDNESAKKYKKGIPFNQSRKKNPQDHLHEKDDFDEKEVDTDVVECNLESLKSTDEVTIAINEKKDDVDTHDTNSIDDADEMHDDDDDDDDDENVEEEEEEMVSEAQNQQYEIRQMIYQDFLSHMLPLEHLESTYQTELNQFVDRFGELNYGLTSSNSSLSEHEKRVKELEGTLTSLENQQVKGKQILQEIKRLVNTESKTCQSMQESIDGVKFKMNKYQMMSQAFEQDIVALQKEIQLYEQVQ